LRGWREVFSDGRNQLADCLAVLFRHEVIKHLVKQWWGDRQQCFALAKPNKSVDVLITWATTSAFPGLEELEMLASDTSARHGPICLFWEWIGYCTVPNVIRRRTSFVVELIFR